MSNVNLNLYRIFCKVAQSKSYSEAAEKLGSSVANVSTQISNLEEQLNLKLFNRESKGVTLTTDGQELYDIVNKSISSFDFAEKMAKDKNDMESGCLKIGCASHFTSYYLMEKIEKVKKDFPKLNVKIVCDFCSSDQRFAYSFLQILPHDRHPCCSAIHFPLSGHVRDLHPLERAHGAQTQKMQVPERTCIFITLTTLTDHCIYIRSVHHNQPVSSRLPAPSSQLPFLQKVHR